MSSSASSARAVLFGSCLVFAPCVGGCSSSSSSTPAAPVKTDDEFKTDVTTGIQSTIAVQLYLLNKAAIYLQAAAPVTVGRGWDDTLDAAALTAMKEAWRRARLAYEQVEGAVAPIFPDIDASIDARYDDFLSTLTAAGGDSYLFDDQGVTGMHAIERILYFKTTPAEVVTFEKALPGYKAQAYPANDMEAADFKNKLCAKLIADSKTLVDQWKPAKIDLATAFAGLISLMNEQREKVNKAATGEEESRYSQLTLADLHANLAGTKSAYGIFQPWVLAKTNADPTKDGPMRDAQIQAGFVTLAAAYDANQGDAIPQPPATWSSENPTAADQATPFGKLFETVTTAVDPNRDGSVVFEMNVVADALGFPRFKQ
jgi:iron uptake system component EfeO